jgi:SAM-dependent methyltransferase
MQRSFEKEILDVGGLLPEVLERAHRRLSQTHSLLGNHAAILRALRCDGTARRVLDIGCGHGGLLKKVRRQMGVEVLGVDLRPLLGHLLRDRQQRGLAIPALRHHEPDHHCQSEDAPPRRHLHSPFQLLEILLWSRFLILQMQDSAHHRHRTHGTMATGRKLAPRNRSVG